MFVCVCVCNSLWMDRITKNSHRRGIVDRCKIKLCFTVTKIDYILNSSYKVIHFYKDVEVRLGAN